MVKSMPTRWVIFVGPEQPPGGKSRYIATDGQKVTDNLRLAAALYTHESAQEFAKDKSIILDGVMRYIGEVNWPYGDV